MTDMNLLANIGMLWLVIGTIPSIYSVLKNRRNLQGFSIIGSLGILIGQSTYLYYFILLNDIITSILSIPLIMFWLIVLLFSFRAKFRAWRDRRKGEREVYRMLGVKNKKEAMKLRDQVFGINSTCSCFECREIRRIINNFNKDVRLNEN